MSAIVSVSQSQCKEKAMQPAIPDGFWEKDPIHEKVLEALKLITGRTFELTQSTTEDGKPIWVYRTTLARPSFEHSDLLDMNRGLPVDSPKLKFSTYIRTAPELATYNAMWVFANIMRKMGELHEHGKLTPIGVDINTIGVDTSDYHSVKAPSGDYHGVLDIHAQTVGERVAVNAESILRLAEFLKGDPSYRPPNTSRYDEPVSDEDRAKVPLLYNEWAEKMRELASNGGRNHIASEALEAAHLIDNRGESPDSSGWTGRFPEGYNRGGENKR